MPPQGCLRIIQKRTQKGRNIVFKQNKNHNKKALVIFSYTFNSPFKNIIKTPLWRHLHSRSAGSISIEAAFVCSLTILFLGAFLMFFVVLQKEFQLKQEMYQSLQIRMMLDEEVKSSEEIEMHSGVSVWGFTNYILIGNRMKYYGFDGYDEGVVDENVYVYITRYGTVYHKELTCSHLNIHISAISAEEVERYRNHSGGKYYPCEFCGTKLLDGICYITDYGERYHGKKDCLSILRNVEKILLTKVNNLEACKDCWK